MTDWGQKGASIGAGVVKFSSSLLGGLVSEVKKAPGTFRSFKNKNFIKRLEAACGLMGSANKAIKMVELEEYRDFLIEEKLANPTEAYESARRCAHHGLDAMFGDANKVLSIIGEARESKEAPMLFQAMLRIAAADGVFDDEEVNLANEVARVLGLNPQELGLPQVQGQPSPQLPAADKPAETTVQPAEEPPPSPPAQDKRFETNDQTQGCMMCKGTNLKECSCGRVLIS